jgi:hypothetical protein
MRRRQLAASILQLQRWRHFGLGFDPFCTCGPCFFHDIQPLFCRLHLFAKLHVVVKATHNPIRLPITYCCESLFAAPFKAIFAAIIYIGFCMLFSFAVAGADTIDLERVDE